MHNRNAPFGRLVVFRLQELRDHRTWVMKQWWSGSACVEVGWGGVGCLLITGSHPPIRLPGGSGRCAGCKGARARAGCSGWDWLLDLSCPCGLSAAEPMRTMGRSCWSPRHPLASWGIAPVCAYTQVGGGLGTLGRTGIGTLGRMRGALGCVLERVRACVCVRPTQCASAREPDKRYRPCAILDSPCGKVP